MKSSIAISWFLFSALFLSACGSSEPASSTTTDAGGGAGTQSATDTELPTDCGLSDAQVLVPPQKYWDGSPICGMRATNDYLTFSAWNDPYWISLIDGQPMSFAEGDAFGYDAAQVFGNDFVFVSGKDLVRIPIAGGTTMHETLPDYCNAFRTFSSDGSRLYCNSGATYEPSPTIDLWYYDLSSRQSTPILEASTTGVQDEYALTSDAIYVRQTGGEGERDTLFKVALEGGPETEIPITGDYYLAILGAGADGLYVAAAAVSSARSYYDGVYRISYAGGAPEKLLNRSIFFPHITTDVTVSKGSTFVRAGEEIYKIPPGGQPDRIAWSTCFAYAMATNESSLFLSVETNSKDNFYEVLQLPL